MDQYITQTIHMNLDLLKTKSKPSRIGLHHFIWTLVSVSTGSNIGPIEATLSSDPINLT